MYTIYVALALATLWYINVLRQVRSGVMTSHSRSGAPVALVALLCFPFAIVCAVLVAAVAVPHLVPYKEITEVYTLEPVGARGVKPDTIVHLHADAAARTTYQVRQRDGAGEISLATIDVRDDVKIYEDANVKDWGVMKKVFKVRDEQARAFKWALFEDNASPCRFELHVPRGSVEAKLSID